MGEECQINYVLEKNGICSIHSEDNPTIIFKDIYRFTFNENANKMFSFNFLIRGITNDYISIEHRSFLIIIFSQKQEDTLKSLRYLENSKNIKTICEYNDYIVIDDSNIKYVDYYCYSNDVNEDLLNYTIISIKEEKENFKKAINLQNLLGRINDINKINSTFSIKELSK